MLESEQTVNDRARSGDAVPRSYEAAYGAYFSMFCERARAVCNGTPYLLGSLLPEVRQTAQQSRERALAAHLPPRRVAYARTAGARTPSRITF